MAVGTNGRRITRDDLEAAFAQVVGEGEATADAAIPQVLRDRRRGGPGGGHPGLPGRQAARPPPFGVLEIRRI